MSKAENKQVIVELFNGDKVAEVLWLEPQEKNYQDFLERLPRLAQIYQLYNWTYRAKSLIPDDENKD